MCTFAGPTQPANMSQHRDEGDSIFTFSTYFQITVLSRLCFCQDKLDQMISEVPSNVVFCDSMISTYGVQFCNPHSILKVMKNLKLLKI